jgi:DNA-binding beta-propeller fold protein YncE
MARGDDHEYAVWWQSRTDSSVVLLSARRVARGKWSQPVIADSTDHGVRGCGRPAPAIAVDSKSGYVHVAYFSEPKSGAGIFFAHSMDTAATFHSPVPIVFGKDPSRVSVASDGDRVVVAYEDPNSTQPIIGIALSNTMGHIFESRSIATSENGRARQPAVRVEGDSIRLWWSEYSADPAVSATRPRYRAALWIAK